MKNVDEIRAVAMRGVRRLGKIALVMYLLIAFLTPFTVYAALFLTSSAVFHAPTWYVVINIVLVCFFFVVVLGGSRFEQWFLSSLDKEATRAHEVLDGLRTLMKDHPELVVQYQLQELLNEPKEQKSFWVNILVNLLFTLAGFALSYAATKLGWLR